MLLSTQKTITNRNAWLSIKKTSTRNIKLKCFYIKSNTQTSKDNSITLSFTKIAREIHTQNKNYNILHTSFLMWEVFKGSKFDEAEKYIPLGHFLHYDVVKDD